MIMKGAEPVYLKGNHLGCVLVHGLSSSPSEMQLLAEYLHGKGYTVIAPLLPGHGTRPEDIQNYSWRDWYGEVEKSLNLLKGDCTKIYLMGLSLGGLLSLYGAAQKLPISGVVSMAAPIYLGTKLAYGAPIFKYFIKSVKKEGNPTIIHDNHRVTYNEQVLHGVHELLKLRRRVKRQLPKIRKPVLIVQSKDDRTVLAESAIYIHNRLGSPLKILKWLSKSGHIITMGPEREEMFTQIDCFINNVR